MDTETKAPLQFQTSRGEVTIEREGAVRTDGSARYRVTRLEARGQYTGSSVAVRRGEEASFLVKIRAGGFLP